MRRYRLVVTSQSRYEALIARARAGESILIDGATGSECIRRGAPVLDNGWSGGAVLSDPDIVRQVHLDYLQLGADFIATNTFSTGRNVLRDAGAEATFEQCNRRAVEIALDARAAVGPDANQAVVAGGISNWSFTDKRPSLDELCTNTIEQAEIMRSAGVDMLSLEMMVDVPQMQATLDAVTSVGLPVWVGFSIGPEEGHPESELPADIPLRDDGLLADAVQVAAGYDCVDAMGIMHTDVRLTARGVEMIASLWDGPIAAYAHAAQQVDDTMTFDATISPVDYAAYVPRWAAAGATMFGGCCGIGPDHIVEVARTLGLTGSSGG